MTALIQAQAMDGLIDYFRHAPERASQAMRMAINDGAKRVALKEARRQIGAQVNLPASYLADPNRLGITKNATNGDLEAILTARARATSLARYAVGNLTPGVRRKGGVQVQVKKGKTTTLRTAFPVRLRSGASLTEDHFNLGLAIRLKPNELAVLGKRVEARPLDARPSKDGSMLYLLYGPSVDQVFQTVADDIAPETMDFVTSEFFRQFDRLSADV